MSKKGIARLAILVLVLGIVGFFVIQNLQKKRQANLEDQYTTVTVTREDLSDTVDTTGTMSFSQNGELYPAYNSTVVRINHKVGDRVRKGELLMVLDSSTLRGSWMEAQNTYTKALYNLQLAEKTLQRNKVLFKAQATTIDTVDTAQNNVDTYRADVQLAQFNLEKLRKNPDGVNYLSPDHSELLIRAPFDGVIAWIDVKPGETVKVASSTSSESTLLLTVAADNSVLVTAKVDESEIDKVKPGQRATVTLNDKQETELEGVVTAAGKIGETDNDVVVFPVEIKVALPPVKVNSGMTTDVTIHVTSRENVLAIPAKTVVNRRGKTMVRIAKGNNVMYIPVQLGEKMDDNVEVLRGLREGDQILVESTTENAMSKQWRHQGMGGGPSMGGGPPMGR